MRWHALVFSFLLATFACTPAHTDEVVTTAPKRTCTDPNADNFGAEGRCTYPPPKPAYTAKARNMAMCGIFDAREAYPYYSYADTTAAAELPTSVESGRRYLYLTDSLGVYRGGLPVSWVSRDTTLYRLGPPAQMGNHAGVVWVVGTVVVEDKAYSDSVPVQVVAKIEDCK